MSEERIVKTLAGLGFSDVESKIYLFLSKRGQQRGREIVRALRINKQQLYPSLKNLQNKGIVSVTLEHPARFSAMPFEKILDLYLKSKIEEVRRIEQSKDQILSDWQSLVVGAAEGASDRFMVIEGRNHIFFALQKMVMDSRSQLCSIATPNALFQVDDSGVLEATRGHLIESNIRFNLLVELENCNKQAAEKLLGEISNGLVNFNARIPFSALKTFPTMVIRDNEEILLFIKPLHEAAKIEKNDVCLWTNCKSLIGAFTTIFEELWRNSIEFGKALGHSKSIALDKYEMSSQRDTHGYWDQLKKAEQDVTILTSSHGLNDLSQKTDVFSELKGRGIKVKILAPVEPRNFEAANSLSKSCTVRHISANYVGLTIIDGKHLYQSQNSLQGDVDPTLFFHSDSAGYIKVIKRTLDEMWEGAQEPSEVTLESITGPYGYDLFPIPKVSGPSAEYDSNRFKLLEVKPPNAVTEQEILNKIIYGRKYRITKHQKTNVMYASAGSAVIHPPEFFHLPRMLINVNHIEKKSSLGEADALEVHLYLDTPSGYMFVAMGGLGDNAKGVLHRKGMFAGTPFEKNYQLVSKDKLQVRVYGNTLFAAWTVPIKLDPWKHDLPPGCIIFEGVGKVKTSSVSVINTSGVRVDREQNWFDAFVNFLHPTSKYSGPGTDGLFARDLVVTMTPP